MNHLMPGMHIRVPGASFFCFQREPTAGPGATAPLPGPGFMMDGASTLGSLEIPAE